MALVGHLWMEVGSARDLAQAQAHLAPSQGASTDQLGPKASPSFLLFVEAAVKLCGNEVLPWPGSYSKETQPPGIWNRVALQVSYVGFQGR